MLDFVWNRTKGVVRFLRRVIASYALHDSSKNAAAIAYYTLFSIFPLLLFLVYAASIFFPSAESRQVLSERLDSIIPYGAENLSRIVEQTWNARGSIGIVSAIGLLWGGSSIFSVLEVSLSHIWESSPRSYFKRRLLGVLAVLSVVLTFLASFFIGQITNFMLNYSGTGRGAPDDRKTWFWNLHQPGGRKKRFGLRKPDLVPDCSLMGLFGGGINPFWGRVRRDLSAKTENPRRG
jgi:uncharacterized BrkB/YihY/UPF0761 family membrane protein